MQLNAIRILSPASVGPILDRSRILHTTGIVFRNVDRVSRGAPKTTDDRRQHESSRNRGMEVRGIIEEMRGMRHVGHGIAIRERDEERGCIFSSVQDLEKYKIFNEKFKNLMNIN